MTDVTKEVADQKAAAERERLNIRQQEAWLDSPEFREARGKWIMSREAGEEGAVFEKSSFYADARYLYRKRTNAGGDGNDG